MLRTIRRISTLVYGLSIVVALAFGANEAFGRAVYSDCIYRPPTFLGACTNTGDSTQDSINCVNACSYYGEYQYARCTTPGHCCECLSH